jgi:hypothetical protein
MFNRREREYAEKVYENSAHSAFSALIISVLSVVKISAHSAFSAVKSSMLSAVNALDNSYHSS